MDTNFKDTKVQEQAQVNKANPSKIVVSFEIEGSNNSEILTLIGRFLGRSNITSIEEPVKQRKPRKTRAWTEEEKAAFHAKMVAARTKKAAIETKQVDPVKTPDKPVAKLEPKVKFVPAVTKVLDPKPKASIIPVPRTGHKVGAKPLLNKCK